MSRVTPPRFEVSIEQYTTFDDIIAGCLLGMKDDDPPLPHELLGKGRDVLTLLGTEDSGLPAGLAALPSYDCSFPNPPTDPNYVPDTCEVGEWVQVTSCRKGDNCGVDGATAQYERQYAPGSDTSRPLCCPQVYEEPCGDGVGCMCYYEDLPIANNTAYTQCGGICDYANVGDDCYIGCADSTMAANAVRFTCMGGKWNANETLPDCTDPDLRQCPDVLSTPDALLRMTVYRGVCDGATDGDECVIHCLPGYYPKGGKTHANCSNGTWSEDLECLPQKNCSDPQHERHCDIPEGS